MCKCCCLAALARVNWIHPPMQLTAGKEKDNQLAFRDVLVTRMTYGFRISVYHRTKFRGRYIKFNSHHPYAVNRMNAKYLKLRATNISSDPNTHQETLRNNHAKNIQ